MAPKLYMHPASGPARAVMLCAKTIGLELDLEIVDLYAREQFEPFFIDINPQHTVPLLVDEDGLTVCDSHAIMAYLVGKYGKDDSLYPKDLKKRAIIDQRLYFECGNVFQSGAKIAKKILFSKQKEIDPNDQKQYQDDCDIVEKWLQNSDYMAGNTLSIADFSFCGSIGTFSTIIPLDKVRYPRLSTWFQKMYKLPSYDEKIHGPGAFEKKIKAILEN